MEILFNYRKYIEKEYETVLKNTEKDLIVSYEVEGMRIGPCIKKETLKRSYNLKNETPIEAKERIVNQIIKKNNFLSFIAKTNRNTKINEEIIIEGKRLNIDFVTNEYVGFIFITSYNFSFLYKNIPFYYLAFSKLINKFYSFKKIKIIILNEFNNEKIEYTLSIFGDTINIVNNINLTEKQTKLVDIKLNSSETKTEITLDEHIFLNKIGELSNKDLEIAGKKDTNIDVRCKKCEFLFLCSNAIQ